MRIYSCPKTRNTGLIVPQVSVQSWRHINAGILQVQALSLKQLRSHGRLQRALRTLPNMIHMEAHGPEDGHVHTQIGQRHHFPVVAIVLDPPRASRVTASRVIVIAFRCHRMSSCGIQL